MQKSVWEYCSLNPDLAVDVEEFQIKLNNRWANKANQDKQNLEKDSASSSSLHDKRHSMAHMQDLLEACDHSCRESLESLDQLLTTIHGIKTSYYDVTSRTNSLMSKCESLLEEQHTLQHTVEVLTKTLKPFKDIEDIAQILGIPYESIHTSHNTGSNSPAPSHTAPSSSSASLTPSSTLTQHLDPRSPEFKELLIKLSSAVIFLQNHPDIMENQKYTLWLEKLQVRAISLIGRAMRELIDKTAKQCRDIIQQRLFASSHHPAITNGGGGGGGGGSGSGTGTSRLFSEDQPVESLPIYQKFRGLSFRMKELVGVLLRGYLSSVTVNDDGTASITNPSDAPPTTSDESPRLRTPSNAIASLGVSSSSALGKYFLHLARHDYAILAEVKKSYALIRMELLQPFLNEAFLHSLANATSSSSTSIVPINANSSGTNFSSLIAEKRLSDVRAGSTGSGKHSSAEAVSHQQHYLSLSTVIRQSFSTLLRIVQLEFQLFDSLFNVDHVHHVTPVSGLTRSISLESSADTIGLSISALPTPRTTASKGGAKRGGAGGGSGHQEDPASVFASDLSRVIEYISNVTRDFLRPLIIRESSVDELCRVISILSEDIKSQIAILQIPAILVKQLTTGLENVMNDSKERVIYCAETKLRQQIQFYEPLPSHLAYPEILETFDKRNEKKTTNVTSADPTSFPSSALSIEDVYDTWYPPMRLTLSLLSKLYGIIDNLIFEDFARRSIEIVITILHQGSETIKRQQKTLMMHGDLFLVRHLLILREQLIPFEVKLQSSEKFLDFTNTRLAIQQIITTSSQSTTSTATSSTSGGGNNANNTASTAATSSFNNLFLRFDENNLLVQFAKSGIPMMKETHQDMKKELDNSLKKACVSLKITACKFLLGPLDGLLAKVVAFIGDIPYQTANNNLNNNNNPATPPEGNGSNKQRGSLLSQEHTSLLKNQSFLRFERMKECFDQVQHLLLQRIPDLKTMMKLYVDNATTRSVLMKSIIQEFEVSKLRTDTIILSCVESGQQKELETSLTVIYRKIVNEFSSV